MYPRLDRADLKHAREFQRTNMEQLREYERERLHEIRKLERKRNVGLQEGERQTLELLKYNKISLQPSKLRYPFGTFYTLKEFLKSCTKTERLIFKMVHARHQGATIEKINTGKGTNLFESFTWYNESLGTRIL